MKESGNGLIGTILHIVFAIILLIVGLRFLFALLGANESSNFVATIYAYSDPLIAPFRGIFAEPITPGASRFDTGALIALVIYGLIGGLLSGASSHRK